MKDTILIAIFIGVPLMIVIGATMQVDPYYTDKWISEKRDAQSTGGPKYERPDPEQPTRWDALTVSGKPLDDKTAGKIVFVARFAGDSRPPQLPIDMGGSPNCINPSAVVDERQEINEDGTIPWVFVEIKGGVKNADVAAGNLRPAELLQEGCVYRPHVIGVIAGQQLWVQNFDKGESHNIKMTFRSVVVTNDAQSGLGKELRYDDKVAQPGIYDLACESHNWMKAKLHVLQHPFFAVSENVFEETKDETTGKVTRGEYLRCVGVLERVPPGEYTLVPWHESFKGSEVKVKVAAGKTAEVTFELQ